MAKLAREQKLRERRAEKQARKDARKFAASDPPLDGEVDEREPLDDAPSPPQQAAAPSET